MQIINRLILNKEARLFDTKEFLLKVFIAVVIGELVGGSIPYIQKDMISLLFGMILVLDPVNLTGFRNGMQQVKATIIGALITGIILALIGYTPWSAAIAITATLYVSLLINWREFSVVAVFTSIYMTQYVQKDALGNPSEIETFKLRIAALLTGVAIAMLVNFLFSIFGYRHMLEKRVYHLLDDLLGKMKTIKGMIEEGNYDGLEPLMASFPSLFNNIDWINGTIIDLEGDFFVKKFPTKLVKIKKIYKIIKFTREMTHINFDFCFKISKGSGKYSEESFMKAFDRDIQSVEVLLQNLDMVIHNKKAHIEIGKGSQTLSVPELEILQENIQHVNQLLLHYR